MRRRFEKGIAWKDYNTRQFSKTQDILSRYTMEKECEEPERIAGVDVAYSDRAYAACMVCDRNMEVLEEKSAVSRIYFPYIPTFFSFREFPALFRVISERNFDLLFVHGHGQAHPRLFGLACHVGLFTGKPTIGIARHPICGKIVGKEVMYEGRAVGAVMGKYIVSVGNLITLGQACRYTALFSKDGFPVPLRLAHSLAQRLKNSKTE